MPKNDGELRDYEVSLSDLMRGRQVYKIAGYASTVFGRDTAVFAITRIIFTDGTVLHVEGEHDIAYIANGENTTLDRAVEELVKEDDEE